MPGKRTIQISPSNHNVKKKYIGKFVLLEGMWAYGPLLVAPWPSGGPYSRKGSRGPRPHHPQIQILGSQHQSPEINRIAPSSNVNKPIPQINEVTRSNPTDNINIFITKTFKAMTLLSSPTNSITY